LSASVHVDFIGLQKSIRTNDGLIRTNDGLIRTNDGLVRTNDGLYIGHFKFCPNKNIFLYLSNFYKANIVENGKT
jgi:hypothetical protein